MTPKNTVKEYNKLTGRRDLFSRSRKRRGSVAFELAAGALLTLAIVAFSLNICFSMIAYGVNDHACRDAARAAAQGTTPAEAFLMANAIVKNYNNTAAGMTPITLVTVLYADFNGTPPAGVAPTVTVTTRSSSKLPAPIAIFGKQVFGSEMPVQKKYVFPIVRLKAPTT